MNRLTQRYREGLFSPRQRPHACAAEKGGRERGHLHFPGRPSACRSESDRVHPSGAGFTFASVRRWPVPVRRRSSRADRFARPRGRWPGREVGGQGPRRRRNWTVSAARATCRTNIFRLDCAGLCGTVAAGREWHVAKTRELAYFPAGPRVADFARPAQLDDRTDTLTASEVSRVGELAEPGQSPARRLGRGFTAG
jgi:hypothetical protein